MANEKKPTPFELIIKGLQERELAALGMTTPEEFRGEALARNLANPPIQEATPESSAIGSFAYDPASQSLNVVWRDRDGIPAHEYLYYGVPQEYGEELASAESKGTYMNGVIKAGFFPWTRLS